MSDVLAIVPARAGSKGIPDKNIRSLTPDGPNLTELAVFCAREAGIPHRVLTTNLWPFPLSSVNLQRNVPDEPPIIWPPYISATRWLRRPPELAQDDTPMLAVVQHVLEAVPGPEDQIIVLLQPTQPFREPRHVQAAIALLRETQADSVVSVVQVPKTYCPWVQFEITDECLEPWESQEDGLDWVTVGRGLSRRQELPTSYRRDGTVYAFWRRTASVYGHIYGRYVRPLIIPPGETCELDTLEDWAEVERRWALRANVGASVPNSDGHGLSAQS